MLFAGFRTLVHGASVEPAKLTARALLEVYLALRFLLYGARRRVPHTSSERGRQTRARYFQAAAHRNLVYRIQAMLDRRVGRREAVAQEVRTALKADAREARRRLKRIFPAQHAAYGNFRFEGPGSKRYFDHLKWYSFSFKHRERVRSVRALAHRLGVLDQYVMLYGPFSALNHPTDTRQDMIIREGRAELLHPHLVTAFPLLTWWIVMWYQPILTMFAKVYLSDALDDVKQVADSTRATLTALPSDLPTGWL